MRGRTRSCWFSALLRKSESLKPACNLLSSLGGGGAHTEATNMYMYLPRCKIATGGAGLSPLSRLVLCRRLYRIAATPPVPAGPCSVGITCRGNRGVAIPSNSPVPGRATQAARASPLLGALRRPGSQQTPLISSAQPVPVCSRGDFGRRGGGGFGTGLQGFSSKSLLSASTSWAKHPWQRGEAGSCLLPPRGEGTLRWALLPAALRPVAPCNRRRL